MGRSRARACALAGLGALALGCAHEATAPPVAPQPQAPAEPVAQAPAAVRAPPEAVFVPPRADPERKAKLVALAPKLDAFYQELVEKYRATGAAVAVVLEGEVTYQKTFGVRDTASKAPVHERTLFRIGSVTKTLTALAVLRLRDQGKLSLDDPAASYFPLIEQLKVPTEDSPPITARHLLTMTSGLPYDDVWGAVSFGFDDAELAAYLGSVELAGPPGGEYRYSNLGFALLGKIIEHAAGLPYAEFVKREVFASLGMTSSGFVTEPLPKEGWATGYFKDGEQLLPEAITSDGVFAPAGGAYTTIADLARYAAFQLSAYPARDDAETGTVRRATLREMHDGSAWARWHESYPVVKLGPAGSPSLTAANYGFGWMENTTCRAQRMVQHRGYEPGYYASIRLMPEQGLGLVVLSTSGAIERLADFERLMDLFEAGGVLERRTPPVPQPLVAVRERVLRLLDAFDPALVARSFDPNTQRYSFMKAFRDGIERVGKQHGKCQPDGEISAVSPRHARFRLSCERGALGVTAYLTPGEPPLLQMLEWRQELPVSDNERAVAAQLAQSLRSGRPPPRAIFTEKAPRTELTQRLAAAHAAHPDCTLGAGYDDGRGNAVFELTCGDTKRALSFTLDPASARVADLSVHAPRVYGATCSE